MILGISGCLIYFMSAMSASAPLQCVQYCILEFELEADTVIESPLDVELTGMFSATGDITVQIAGFWDGGRSWKLRFKPLVAGEWHYTIQASHPSLHEKSGTIQVAQAQGSSLLEKHGGILQVSENRRHLTYSDGTPFFWLGDTWWFAPSEYVPLEGSTHPDIESAFKHMTARRKAQGYSIIHMAFLGPNSHGVNSFQGGEIDPKYWQIIDQYMDYTNAEGLIPVVGLAFHSGLDWLNLEQWKQIWRYFIARYGAHDVSWLVCGEYNQHNVPERVEKAMALGAFIKKTDPYQRAMTIHPWWYRGEERQAWDAPWYDFVMLQGAHEADVPAANLYWDVWFGKDTGEKHPIPVLEGEARYEGIRNINENDVRATAYRAIQAGSFGFTYGSHGLWYPTQDENDETFKEWGDPIPWWEALERPGGAQMKHLRSYYEMLPWWNLEPLPNGIQTVNEQTTFTENQRVLVKAHVPEVYSIYFPAHHDTGIELYLAEIPSESSYQGHWYNPRTGEKTSLPETLSTHNNTLSLPAPPDTQDWLLALFIEVKK